MIRSVKLAEIFDSLGIKNEILAVHRQHEADSIIKHLFGSHDNARRLHYLLKERGWFDYPQEKYFYRIFEDPNSGTWWISVYKMNPRTGGLEEEFRVSTGGAEVGLQVKAGPILTREHVKEENEESYFHRVKGWI